MSKNYLLQESANEFYNLSSLEIRNKKWEGTIKIFILLVMLLWSGFTSAQRQMEKLDRGVVAIKTNKSEVYISWRLFGNEPSDIGFNVYRGNKKINASPIVNSTNFIDKEIGTVYSIKPVIKGKESGIVGSATVQAQPYLNVPLQIPAGGTTPSGETYTYNANDASVGDLDGDGAYDIILKWDPSNAKDNSQKGYTGNVYIDGYKLDGTRLWRIDLGKNVRAGAHYTQLMVYDLDGDGIAEVACRTSDGTVDGTGVIIGKADADYRNSNGYILEGPEYLTVFNGKTGKAITSVNYLPERAPLDSWGDSYGNRVDRFVAGVAYLDGQRPSLIMGRGYYTRLVRAAWDWRDGKLTNRWTFDSNNPGNEAYFSQGNHQVTVGDMDGDGKDELCNGSSAIDDDGKGLWANGLGHGDALHMSDLDPDRPGLEIWMPLETPARNGNVGAVMLDAKTGEVIWKRSVPSGDIGRAMTADIDPGHKGYEMWSSCPKEGIFNNKGIQISSERPSINFGIWWDADFSRELLNSNKIDKWDPPTNATINLLTASECTSNNGTKSTPALSADILGDWREEVILRTSDNTALHIYTTTIPTSNRIYTLMHDPQYRVAIAWQNTAYNQPPHPGFYIGTDMAAPPTPHIELVNPKVLK